MGKKLAYTFHLDDPDGNPQVLLKGTDAPDWAQKALKGHSGPYEDDGSDTPDEEPVGPTEDVRPEGTASEVTPVGTQGAGAVGNPPPKAGPGASKKAWQDYAAANGVDTADAESRDDVIDAVNRAGVPTE